MSELAHVDDLPALPHDIVTDAVDRARAAGCTPADSRTDSYTKVSGAAGHDGGVYVHKGSFSVALDLKDAEQVCRENDGFRLEDKKPTGHVHVPFDLAAEKRELVTELIERALVRSAAKTWRSASERRGSSNLDRVQPICPKHGIEVAITGRCSYCDEEAGL